MEEAKNTHWRKIMNTEYLNGDEIEEQIVTIKSWEERNFYSQKTKMKEDHVVLLFDEIKKPMILTNRKAKAISAVLKTSLMAEWIGKTITIFPREEKHFGEIFKVINIKRGVRVLPELTKKHKRWSYAVDKVSSGETTIEAIRKSFYVSDAVEKQLNKEVKSKTKK